MKNIKLKQLFCKHDEIIWDKVKTMIYPEIFHGVCKKCGKKCNKIGKDGKVIWE